MTSPIEVHKRAQLTALVIRLDRLGVTPAVAHVFTAREREHHILEAIGREGVLFTWGEACGALAAMQGRKGQAA